MRSPRVFMLALAVAALLAGCGGSGAPASPEQTISTFMHAAASGDGTTACAQLSSAAEQRDGTTACAQLSSAAQQRDGTTACAQLSSAAQQQVVQGTSCEQGIELGAGLYGSIIKQIQITDLSTSDSTASRTTRLNGTLMATFRLTKSGGKWLIADEQLLATPGQHSAGSSAGPTDARVTAVQRCIASALGPVDNFGTDSTGGVRHVVISVNVNRLTAAEVSVFGSAAAAAASAYPAIKAQEGSLVTKLGGDTVIVYMKPLSAGQQHSVEACT